MVTGVRILRISDSGLRALAGIEGEKPRWLRIRKSDQGDYILFGGVPVYIPKELYLHEPKT